MKLYCNPETGKIIAANKVWAEKELMLYSGYIYIIGRTKNGNEKYDSLNYSIWRKFENDKYIFTKVSKFGAKKKKKMPLFGWEMIIDEDGIFVIPEAIEEIFEEVIANV